MKTEPDSFAYPIAYDDNDVNMVYGGLTKRELFAAMAMQGLQTWPDDLSQQKLSKWAVNQADALIAELNKDQDDE